MGRIANNVQNVLLEVLFLVFIEILGILKIDSTIFCWPIKFQNSNFIMFQILYKPMMVTAYVAAQTFPWAFLSFASEYQIRLIMYKKYYTRNILLADSFGFHWNLFGYTSRVSVILHSNSDLIRICNSLERDGCVWRRTGLFVEPGDIGLQSGSGLDIDPAVVFRLIWWWWGNRVYDPLFSNRESTLLH